MDTDVLNFVFLLPQIPLVFLKIQANWTLCKLQYIQTQFKIYKFKINHNIGHISVLCINDLKFWENDNGKSAASYLVTYLN